MARVYLETSFISACVTTRKDVASAYRHQMSIEWWGRQAPRHNLYVSQEVLAELSNPSFPQREEAIDLIAGIPLLTISDEALGLAAILVREKVMPSPVAGDAIHVAVATVHDIDYLVSWNVRHLANANKITHLRTVCLRIGFLPPQIVTPELLWEDHDE